MYLKIFFTILFLALVLGGLFVVLNRNFFREESEPASKPTMLLEPTAASSQSHFEIKGSIPYWDQDRALLSFEKHIDKFDYINLFWYYLNADGSIEKYQYAKEDKSIIDFAHENGVGVLAVITNLPEYDGASWDSKRVESVITDEEIKKNHIESIRSKLNQLEFDGIIIDYESVDSFLKGDFSSFIKSLSGAIHKDNKLLGIALHPKTGENKKDESNGLFQDWEALEKYSDHLNIMGYGEHWDEGSAGPIASAPWVEEIIKYSQSLNIAPSKFVLGIPLYGFDWNKDDDSAALGLVYDEVQSILSRFDMEEQWNENLLSPYFFYEDEGDMHEVWFENAESVEKKIKIAKKAGFAGVTFWRLGGEDQEIWEAVATE